MVLVTRSSSQGNLFKEATTPNWLDGDLWSDTTANILKLNVAGTAEDVGTELSSLLTTEGDIVYRNATIPARLAKGTATQHLLMNAGATAPEWTTFVGVTITTQQVAVTANFTTDSTSYVDITGLTVTMPMRTGGKFNLSTLLEWSADYVTQYFLRYVDNITNKSEIKLSETVANTPNTSTFVLTGSLAGQAVKMQTHSELAGRVITVYGTSGNSRMESLEIS